MKLVKESLNELLGFEHTDDVNKNLHLGKRAIIENWLKKVLVYENESTQCLINNDLTIDTYTNIHIINNPEFTEFPDYIQFKNSFGSFSIYNNNLTTLRGCPEIVDGSFYCDKNNLSSLKYCPKVVRNMFECGDNKTKFTKNYVLSLCNVKRILIII